MSSNGRDEHSPQLRECLRGHELLTGHVENGVCRELLFYKPEGLTGRYDDRFDVAALRLSFTSFITGERPYAPVPITSRWHFQGIPHTTSPTLVILPRADLAFRPVAPSTAF